MKESILAILKRFKSPVVWASLGATILWLLKASGRLEYFGLDADNFNMGWNIITGLLVSLGILNNPTSKNNF